MPATSFYCYLIRSNASSRSTATYIGFSTRPLHRLRQHNGELTQGARKTSRFKKWIHVCIVSGFPNKVVALQFEWQWQHPAESRIARSALDFDCRSRGYQTNLRVLKVLLNSALWRQLQLRVHFFDECIFNSFMKEHCEADNNTTNLDLYTMCPPDYTDRPPKMIISLDTEQRLCCNICHVFDECSLWRCPSCQTAVHLTCFATHLQSACCAEHSTSMSIIPRSATCITCSYSCAWIIVVQSASNVLGASDESEVEGSQSDEEDEEDALDVTEAFSIDMTDGNSWNSCTKDTVQNSKSLLYEITHDESHVSIDAGGVRHPFCATFVPEWKIVLLLSYYG